MARSRNIKPSIMDNEDLAELEPITRLLFIYLWMLADREGRLEDRPKRIGAQAFPYDKNIDPDELLTLLQRSGFVERYEKQSKRYIQITGFTKHQTPHHKETASEIPPPDGKPAITRHPYSVSQELRDRTFRRDGNRCLRCGCETSLTIDHIVPLSKGGDNSPENLQTLCHRCNSSKGDAIKSYLNDGCIETSRTNSSKGQRRTYVDDPCPPDSLIPDSLIPDSLIPDSKTLAQAPIDFATEEFGKFWSIYPKRPGSSKADAFKAWKARIKAGEDPQKMIEGAMKYATYCTGTNTEPQFIKHPATFLGPGKHYESNWTPPPRASPKMSHSDSSKLSAARTIFGTEIEGTSHATGRVIDITPTASGSVGGEDISGNAGQLRLSVSEPVEDRAT